MTPRRSRPRKSRCPSRLVQAPANLLDQRLLRDGSLRALKDAGCEVHVRSAFLQGLLIGLDGPLPAYFQRYAAMLDRVRATAATAKLSTLELALGFLLEQPDIDHVIVGVTRAEELAAILDAARRPIVDTRRPRKAGLRRSRSH